MAKNRKNNDEKTSKISPFSSKGLLIGLLNSIGASMIIYAVVLMLRNIPLVINGNIQIYRGLFLTLALGYFLFLYLLRSKLGDGTKARIITLLSFAVFATAMEMIVRDLGMSEISVVAYISIFLTALIASTMIK